ARGSARGCGAGRRVRGRRADARAIELRVRHRHAARGTQAPCGLDGAAAITCCVTTTSEKRRRRMNRTMMVLMAAGALAASHAAFAQDEPDKPAIPGRPGRVDPPGLPSSEPLEVVDRVMQAHNSRAWRAHPAFSCNIRVE